MHHVELWLEVSAEPRWLHATKDIETDAEVAALISDFLLRFMNPDRGPQEIRITIASAPTP
jgi:hypothetical protein